MRDGKHSKGNVGQQNNRNRKQRTQKAMAKKTKARDRKWNS